MLTADRALLESGLGRTGPVAEHPSMSGRWQAIRTRVRPAVFHQTCRRALSMFGARKQYSVTRNLREVGPLGLVRAAVLIGRETLFDRPPDPAVRRPGYFIELGSRTGVFDLADERLPPSAGARLLGLDEFLKSLPELVERRRWIQARRTRDDADVLGPFSSHWLSSTPSVAQRAHDELQQALREVFGIDEVVMPAATVRAQS
jgi:hypothetical protein